MPRNETFRRYLLFIISLFFVGFGIAFAQRSGLGLTPISSIPNVIFLKTDALSFGTLMFLENCGLLLLQIIVLRKDFQKIQLLQIPLSFIFGLFVDLGVFVAGRFPIDTYYYRFLAVLIGTVITGFGVALSVIANVILNSGDGAVKAIADKTKFVFGNVKIGFDLGCVALSTILSLIFFDMHIKGIREGTLFGAIFTGVFVKLFMTNIKDDVEKWLTVERRENDTNE